MCHESVIEFGERNLYKEEIAGKRILEVGSYNVNGSLRGFVMRMGPSEYIGIDIQKGDCVDIVCNAEDIVEKFGRESFDVVISTEMLEHLYNWKKVISNIKRVCKKDGIMLISTRSYGFAKHDYPGDYWRYEIDNIKDIFSDCNILKLESDKQYPGVFVKIRKPDNFIENDLVNYEVFNMKTIE